MQEHIKQQIDEMSYTQLLRRWRHAPSSDAIFQGESGQHFKQVMQTKEAKLAPGEKTRISKEIGW